jgi:hypothetical protein
MHATLRSPKSRIPVEQVSTISREIADRYARRVDIVGVIPTEGGGDRVEVFVSLALRDLEQSRASVVVDRAVTQDELRTDLASRLHAVIEGLEGHRKFTA